MGLSCQLVKPTEIEVQIRRSYKTNGRAHCLSLSDNQIAAIGTVTWARFLAQPPRAACRLTPPTSTQALCLSFSCFSRIDADVQPAADSHAAGAVTFYAAANRGLRLRLPSRLGAVPLDPGGPSETASAQSAVTPSVGAPARFERVCTAIIECCPVTRLLHCLHGSPLFSSQGRTLDTLSPFTCRAPSRCCMSNV